MMLSWWYKILGELFLSEYNSIPHEVSRRDKIRGRYIVSYLIHENPKIGEGRIEQKKYSRLLFKKL